MIKYYIKFRSFFKNRKKITNYLQTKPLKFIELYFVTKCKYFIKCINFYHSFLNLTLITRYHILLVCSNSSF